MKKTQLLLLSLCLGTSVMAQQKENGSINSTILLELNNSYKLTQNDIAVRNALNSTPILTLAQNASNQAMIDTHFSNIVKTKGITNQQSSGRCWLFTGLNVMRARMIDKYNLGAFQFSQSYLFFYDQLEKANLFLQSVIDTSPLNFEDRKVDFLFKHPIGDGGQFTGVADLVTKYGVVPADIMPESYVANHTSQMNSMLSNKLREAGLALRAIYDNANISKLSGKKAEKAYNDVLAKQEALKIEQLKDVYRILALCLGVPPKEFTYTLYNADGKEISTKTYTPQSFYKEYIGADLENNYVMLMNDPTRPYYKVYEIELDRHVYEGHNWLYINLPIEEIKKVAINSIKDNTAMYFSCDVGKFLDKEKGVLDLNNYDFEALLGVKFGMDKTQRVKSYASGSSHAMTLIAVDIKDNKPTKWMVENSWGANNGYKGNLIMTDQWFDNYMFRLVVQKKYVGQDILQLLNNKPISLPIWDPMFISED